MTAASIKKTVPSSISFLKDSYPDVFHIKPRSGGYLNASKDDGFATSSKIGDDLFAGLSGKISREFKVQSALDETESIDTTDATLPNPINDFNYVIGIAVSSIVLMAADVEVPDEYLDWTEKCLDNVVDDFGNHPPNVQGLLNQIRRKRGKPVVQTNAQVIGEPREGGNNEANEDPDREQTVKTTTKLFIGPSADNETN